MMGGALSLGTASQGGKVAWIVPTYMNGRSLWRWCEMVTGRLVNSGRVRMNKSERIIEFQNGGFLGVYSADNEHSIRGESFNLAILDEAARISETAWTDAIQPTLADFDGDAILISTPLGMNWFHTEWVRGRDKMNGEIAAWVAPSSANPSPQIKAAAEKARQKYGDNSRTFRQEWLAEFVEDGAYFQNVDNAATIDQPDDPEAHKDHYVVAGLDWAMQEDYTVLTVACRDCNRVIGWDRFNQISYTYQRERITDYCKRYHVQGLLPERNSIGQPNIEILQSAGLPVLNGTDEQPGFVTTATTKPALIQRLASGLEHDGFRVPRDYGDELRSYQVEVGIHPKFSAPTGMHDDRVISLALAWWAMTSGQLIWAAT